MKARSLNQSLLVTAIFSFFVILPNGYAEKGGANGGGGDYTETVINDIRVDIQSWISKGGAVRLQLPGGLSYEAYVGAMSSALAPHAIVIGSISAEEESRTLDPDLKVSVDGQPKTCRGSTWKKDGLPHILCIIERFVGTPESERYPLVHHEYAGLAGVEKNNGASSDYFVSSQLTGFLEKTEVLKLAVKPKIISPRSDNGCVPQESQGQHLECVDHVGIYDGQEFKLVQELVISATNRNYFVNGQKVTTRQASRLEGQTYCNIFVSKEGAPPNSSPLLPKSLVRSDGTVALPTTASPYEVSNSSWYESSIFFGASVQGEKLGIGIICGHIEQQRFVESKATSLNEILQAFKGLFIEAE